MAKPTVTPVAFDPSTIDSVYLSPDGDRVTLYIDCNPPMTGLETEIATLRAKVKAYMIFAVEGQMVELYPKTEGLPWYIVLQTRAGEPSVVVKRILAKIADAVRISGGTMTHEVPEA